MTMPNSAWDNGLSALLDKFRVPAPRASLVEDIVAAATSRKPHTFLALWPNHTRRNGWARRGAVAGLVSFGLVSAAAAAATGWFGQKAMELPVIATIAKVLPVSVKIAASEPVIAAKKATIAAPAEPVEVAQADAPPKELLSTAEMTEIRRAFRVRRFADQFERRIAMRDGRRAAFGLPADSEQDRALLIALRASANDSERIAIFEKIGRLHDARRRELRPDGSMGRPHLAWGSKPRRPICTAEQAADPFSNHCRSAPPNGSRPAINNPQDELTAARLMRRHMMRCDAIPLDLPLPRHCRPPDAQSDFARPPADQRPPSTDEQVAEPVSQ